MSAASPHQIIAESTWFLERLPVEQIEALLPWNLKAMLDEQKKSVLKEQNKELHPQQSPDAFASTLNP